MENGPQVWTPFLILYHPIQGIKLFVGAGPRLSMELRSAVPSVIWDAFEEALQTNMYRLVKDIAATVGKPHKPLMDAIKAKKIRPYIADTGDDAESLEFSCDFLCVRASAPAIQQVCGQPILWGAGVHRCPSHLFAAQPTNSLPTVKSLTTENLFAADGILYDGAFQAVGTITDTEIRIFEVELEKIDGSGAT